MPADAECILLVVCLLNIAFRTHFLHIFPRKPLYYSVDNNGSVFCIASNEDEWIYLTVFELTCSNPITHTHTHTTILWPSWILSGTTRVSQHQKGKINLDLLEQEIVNGRHITMPAFDHSFLRATV